jgi:hypothetical protein
VLPTLAVNVALVPAGVCAEGGVSWSVVGTAATPAGTGGNVILVTNASWEPPPKVTANAPGVTGKSCDEVWPVTTTAPLPSRAISRLSSPSLPPRKVE